MGVAKEEERRRKNKYIMVFQKLSSLLKNNNPHIQEAQRTLNRMTKKEPQNRHIRVKLFLKNY